MVYQATIELDTARHGHMLNITADVAVVVGKSKILKGVVHVFSVGSTAAVGTIEFEPGLERDFPELLERLIPPSLVYGHERAWHDGNGHSHLQASLLGPSLSVPLSEGRVVLGTWQQIFMVECDIHARRREVVVTVLGE